MTSIADRISGPPLAAEADAIAREAATAPAVPLPAIVFPVGAERELRLDLFRGLALWLIFVDHLPNNLLTWLTIRNYGFSDATEIFIFISGYTAAFVYGRAMREVGFVVASARILRRVWQIYVAHVFLFTIFLAEISYLAFAFFVTMTWYFPQLSYLLPKWLEKWMYPITKTDLDVLRFAHFLALAALTVRFLPRDWPPLKSIWLRPLILCGQHSLEIFCLGGFLPFAGHFVLAESAGGAWRPSLI